MGCCVANRTIVQSKALIPEDYVQISQKIISSLDSLLFKLINLNISPAYKQGLSIIFNSLYSYVKTLQASLESNQESSKLKFPLDDDAIQIIHLSLEEIDSKILNTENSGPKAEDQLFLEISRLHSSFIGFVKKTALNTDEVQCLKLALGTPIKDLLANYENNKEADKSKIEKAFEANQFVPKLKCGKCPNNLQYCQDLSAAYYPDSPPENISDLYFCDICGHLSRMSSPFYFCRPCNFTACRLCDGSGLEVGCPTCSTKLVFTKTNDDLKYPTENFRCDVCGKDDLMITDGLHHCEKDKYDLCVDCRTKYYARVRMYLVAQNERLWKNEWVHCPVLTDDRAYSHDSDFKNASLENIALEDGWDWMGDWKKINAGEGWEYGVSWNGEYFDNKAGKFVRQRLWIRKAVKLMRDN